jgi:hypothetical protein
LDKKENRQRNGKDDGRQGVQFGSQVISQFAPQIKGKGRIWSSDKVTNEKLIQRQRKSQ